MKGWYFQQRERCQWTPMQAPCSVPVGFFRLGSLEGSVGCGTNTCRRPEKMQPAQPSVKVIKKGLQSERAAAKHQTTVTSHWDSSRNMWKRQRLRCLWNSWKEICSSFSMLGHVHVFFTPASKSKGKSLACSKNNQKGLREFQSSKSVSRGQRNQAGTHVGVVGVTTTYLEKARKPSDRHPFSPACRRTEGSRLRGWPDTPVFRPRWASSHPLTLHGQFGAKPLVQGAMMTTYAALPGLNSSGMAGLRPPLSHAFISSSKSGRHSAAVSSKGGNSRTPKRCGTGAAVSGGSSIAQKHCFSQLGNRKGPPQARNWSKGI